MWTPREMRAGVKALAYPKPHPLKVTCRGAGAAAGNLYTAFRCKATYRHHRNRTFAIASGFEGGWICAGRHLNGCRVLAKGFLGSSQITRWGGLEAAAGYTATGYIQRHYSSVQPQSGSPCSPIGSTRYQCAYSTPAVTVTVTYKRVTGGWLVTATS